MSRFLDSARSVARAAREFRRVTRGNVSIIFGLCLIPLVGIVGLCVDYGIGITDKSRLDHAADAAAVAAVATAKAFIAANPSDPNASANAIIAGKAQAAAAFAVNSGSVPFATVATPSISLVPSGSTLTSQVSYTATTQNHFGQIFNVPLFNLSGTSSASATVPKYLNFYVLVDTSQSMGIGATAADMQNLYNRVVANNNGPGCVFGCHVPEPGQWTSNENLAHNTVYGTPITLRIDSAKSAIQTLINDATTANANAGINLIKVGIYGMQQDPQNVGSYIQPVVDPPNYDFSTSSTKVAAMTLGNNNSGGSGDTGFFSSLNSFVNNILPAQGDGNSAMSPLNYVFIITDGMGDVPGACTFGHCTQSFLDTYCQPIKSKSTMGVIYTTYLPIYNQNNPSNGYDNNYTVLALPYVGYIAGNLQRCASTPDLYFEASDGPSISTGLQKLFNSTTSQTHLTQ